jgi:hypothetical protein
MRTVILLLSSLTLAQAPAQAHSDAWYDSTFKRLERLSYVFTDSQATEFGKHRASTRWGHLGLMAKMYSDSLGDVERQREFENELATPNRSTTDATLPAWATYVRIASLVCGAIAALLLAPSGRGFAGFGLGIVLGPVGVIVAAILRLERHR